MNGFDLGVQYRFAAPAAVTFNAMSVAFPTVENFQGEPANLSGVEVEPANIAANSQPAVLQSEPMFAAQVNDSAFEAIQQKPAQSPQLLAAPNFSDKYSRSNISVAVHGYIDAFVGADKLDEDGRDLRVLDRLYFHREDNQGLCDYLRSLNPDQMKFALEIASRSKDSSGAGMCMGFVGVEAQCDVGSKDFQAGFRNGLAMTYKVVSKSEARILKLAKYASLIGSFSHVLKLATHGFIEPANSFLFNYVKSFEKPVMATTIFCVLYGGLTMFTTGLYKRDAFVSENLITSGPFSLHRNPYYASMAVGLSVPAIYVAALDALSANPSFVSSALMIGGLACLFRAAHKRVLRDEKSLEAAFGQKYLDYKKTTPRYVPSLINRVEQKEE